MYFPLVSLQFEDFCGERWRADQPDGGQPSQRAHRERAFQGQPTTWTGKF